MQPPSVLRLIKAGSNRWSMADIFLRDDRRAKSNRMEQSLSQQIGVSFLPGRIGIPSDFLPGEDIAPLDFIHYSSRYALSASPHSCFCSGPSSIFPTLMSILEFALAFIIDSLFTVCGSQLWFFIKHNWLWVNETLVVYFEMMNLWFRLKVSHPMRLLNSFPCCQKT